MGNNPDKYDAAMPSTQTSTKSKNMLEVIDKSGKSLDFDKIILQLPGSSVGVGADGMKSLNNIDELRHFEPESAGQIVALVEYASGTQAGGGLFLNDTSPHTVPEDYGLNIITPKGKRWTRILNDRNQANVSHFGAVPDGKTDCIHAVTRMWNWSQHKTDGMCLNESIGIRFPAGRFFISTFDISHEEVGRFRIAGENVSFGYYCTTTLISDKKNDEYMFTVKARWTEITGLNIDGESDYEHKITNTKGFFRNIIDGGQFVRVSGMYFTRLGGKGLCLLDTLDTKIDQWYASKCHDSVIYATYSGRKEGSWDHITAIELSNFNIQHGFAKPMIDLQRAGQSLIWNGWIEHCEDPGNISNGQWVIHSLNLESNILPLKCHYTRVISSQLDIQNGKGLDLSDAGERWLSEYEMGQTFIENHGIRIVGSLSYDFISSHEFMDNHTGQAKWFLLGEIEVDGWTCQAQINLVGSATYSKMARTQKDYDGSTSEGGARISIQNVEGTLQATWAAEGASPLRRMYLESSGTNKSRIYLLIPEWTGFVKAFVTTNSADRFRAGVHFRFIKSYTQVAVEKAKQLNEAADICFHQHWIGNEKVGLGYNHNHELLFHVSDVKNNQLKIRVNGKLYTIALTPAGE